MIDTALRETGGAWGTRPLVRAFSLGVFLLLLHAPWEPLRQGMQSWMTRLSAAGTTPLGALIILVSAVILLIAYRVLRYLSPILITLLSGEILPMRVVSRHFVSKQRKLAERVKSRPELIEVLRLIYPEAKSEIRPSRLGNILRSAELYPLVRYEMESIILWPRLVHLLSDRDLKILDQEKDALLFFLELSFITLTSAIFWTVGRPLFEYGPPAVLIVAAYVLSYGFYRLSLRPAMSYGRLIRVYTDLYRLSLLETLGQRPPANLLEEQKTWRRISGYLLTGDADEEQLAQLFAQPDGEVVQE